MKTGQTQSLGSVLAAAAVVAWVDPTELYETERNDHGLRRILKAVAAVAVFCLLVSFGPALLVSVDENRRASPDGAGLVDNVAAAAASGTHHQEATPRYAQR